MKYTHNSASGIVGGFIVYGEPGPESVLPIAPKRPPYSVPVTPSDTPDVEGSAYLAMGRDDLQGAISWLTLALKSRSDWQEALGDDIETLRRVLAAVESELEATP